MSKVVNYAMRGMGYGAVTYLILIAIDFESMAVTSSSIFSVLIMSALLGIISMVFDYDKLAFLVALGIHFCGTLVLVISMLTYNGWKFVLTSGSFWWSFILIYIFIWIAVMVNQHVRVVKVNKALKKRNRIN
ncbi:DUF3021 domain-containing protein [Companilactobacillus kedongensis]|uniref:DUF3021 domain-containing protein n=1 Tax=Companilactobacillus kedongensis TaxID=2486004 RepID=UPI000F7A74BC|nr:DUF3021 domain-containing protein [Companilactobacillus kedongensis]